MDTKNALTLDQKRGQYLMSLAPGAAVTLIAHSVEDGTAIQQIDGTVSPAEKRPAELNSFSVVLFAGEPRAACVWHKDGASREMNVLAGYPKKAVLRVALYQDGVGDLGDWEPEDTTGMVEPEDRPQPTLGDLADVRKMDSILNPETSSEVPAIELGADWPDRGTETEPVNIMGDGGTWGNSTIPVVGAAGDLIAAARKFSEECLKVSHVVQSGEFNEIVDSARVSIMAVTGFAMFLRESKPEGNNHNLN